MLAAIPRKGVCWSPYINALKPVCSVPVWSITTQELLARNIDSICRFDWAGIILALFHKKKVFSKSTVFLQKSQSSSKYMSKCAAGLVDKYVASLSHMIPGQNMEQATIATAG